MQLILNMHNVKMYRFGLKCFLLISRKSQFYSVNKAYLIAILSFFSQSLSFFCILSRSIFRAILKYSLSTNRTHIEHIIQTNKQNRVYFISGIICNTLQTQSIIVFFLKIRNNNHVLTVFTHKPQNVSLDHQKLDVLARVLPADVGSVV